MVDSQLEREVAAVLLVAHCGKGDGSRNITSDEQQRSSSCGRRLIATGRRLTERRLRQADVGTAVGGEAAGAQVEVGVVGRVALAEDGLHKARVAGVLRVDEEGVVTAGDARCGGLHLGVIAWMQIGVGRFLCV